MQSHQIEDTTQSNRSVTHEHRNRTARHLWNRPPGQVDRARLARQGKRVRLINRSGQATDLPVGAEVVKADAYDTRQTIELTAGATAVYQCAQPGLS